MAAKPSANRERNFVVIINGSKRENFSVLSKPLFFWGRLILGGIFMASSVDKILHPEAFAQAVYNYQILPDFLVNFTAIFLPWLEAVLGFLLVFGRCVLGAVFISNVLLTTFFGALMFNIARGLDIHCGCFTSATGGDPATTWYIIRDSGFLALGFYLFLKTFCRRAQVQGSPLNP